MLRGTGVREGEGGREVLRATTSFCTREKNRRGGTARSYAASVSPHVAATAGGVSSSSKIHVGAAHKHGDTGAQHSVSTHTPNFQRLPVVSKVRGRV